MEQKKNKPGKRLCSLLLALIMCTVMLPVSLWAEDGGDTKTQSSSTETAQSDESLPEQSGTGSISGTIWLDKNDDGVYDSSESSVAGYEVSLYLSLDTNEAVTTVTTDGSGNYMFKDLEPNDYVVGLPLSQSVNETEYLVPIVGISGDNKFALDTTTYNAYTDSITITAGTEAKEYSGGVRSPAGIQTLSVGIQPESSTNYTVNNTVIGFAGQEWWVIGDDISGVTSPQADSVTLWSKTYNSSYYGIFNPYTGTTGNNKYDGSTHYTTINSYASNLLSGSQEANYVIDRAAATIDQDAWTYVNGVNDTNATDSVYGYGSVSSYQTFWPLSKGEWETVGTGTNDANVRSHSTNYWLRSPYSTYVSGVWVGSSSGASSDLVNVSLNRGARPAFYLNLSSVIFTSDASGTSMKSTTAGSTLQDVSTTWTGSGSSEPIKLTMEETNTSKLALTTTTTEITAAPGGQASFDYADAQTGAGKSVSIIIYDSTGTNMLYYGRPVDTSAGNTSGWATFDIPSSLSPGDYTLKVFNEQVNGANYTDYASTPRTITLKVSEVTVVLSANPDNAKVYDGTVDITAVVGNHTSISGSAIEDVEWFRVPVSNTTDYSSSFDSEYAAASSTDKGTISDPGTSETTETFNLTVDKNAKYWFKGRVIDSSTTYTAVEAITVDNIYTTTSVSVRGQISSTGSYLYDYEVVSGTYGIPYDLDGITILASAPSQGYDEVILSGKTYTMYKASTMKSGSNVPFTLTLDGDFLDPALNTECDGGDIAKYTMLYTVNTGINSTIIGYAGQEWWVIGDDSSGVTSPLSSTVTSSVTLWQKDWDGTATIFNPYVYPYPASMNEYDGSNLQGVMNALDGTMYTSGANGNAQEEDYLIAREGATIDQDAWTYIGGVNDTNIDDYWNYSWVSSDQKFWPLSKGEWEAVGDTPTTENVRSFSAFYWLRSPSSSSVVSAWIGDFSGASSDGAYVSTGNGARPALYLDLSSVLFTSDASGASMKPAAGQNLTAVAAPTGAIKLTMEETDTSKLNLSSSMTTVSAPPGGSVDIQYSGAVTGTNKNVSIMICDQSTGENLYYGRLVDLDPSGAGGPDTGTAAFNVPSGLGVGDYTLKVFNEEVNDANITDYASTPVEITLKIREVTVGLTTTPAFKVYDSSVDITAVVGNHIGVSGSVIEDVEWFCVPAGAGNYSDVNDFDNEYLTNAYSGTLSASSTSGTTATFNLPVSQNATYWFKGTVTDSSGGTTITYTTVESITVDNIYTSTTVSVRGQIGSTGSCLYDYEVVSGNYGVPYNLDGTILTSPRLGYDDVILSGKTYTMYKASTMKSGSKVPFTLTLDGDFLDPALNTECDSGDIAKYTMLYTANTGINSTIIGFAGHEWWVIGDASSGVTSPQNDSVTLWSKDYDFGDSYFDNTVPYSNKYDGSVLQSTMNALDNSMFASVTNSNNLESRYVINRSSMDQYDETGNDSNGYGTVSSDQMFWPLSYQEWDTVSDGSVRSYGAPYWLRSPTSTYVDNAWVGWSSGAFSYASYVSSNFGARPAFYLDLSSVLFTSDADMTSGTGMKSSASAGSPSLAAATTPSGAIKLTMEEKDTGKLNLSTTTSEITAPPEEEVTFDYDNAVTGTNKSVSIIICDQSTGEILYYGRPVDLSGGGATGSGTATFKLPSGLALGNYTLKVFNEEVNGANYTDYASTMKEITLRVQTPAKVDFDTANVDKELTLAFSDSSLTDADTVNITTTKASDVETVFSENDFTISSSGTEKRAVNGFSVTTIGNSSASDTTLTIEEDYSITEGNLSSAYLWYQDTCVGEFVIRRSYETTIAIEDKSVTYSGTIQTIGDASVSTGYKGTVTYTYYTDDAYMTKTGAAGASGAESEGGAPKNAGTYYVIAEAGANGIYTNASDKAKLEIAKLSINITADNQTITYGDALKADGYTVTGNLAANQSITAITLTPSGTTITDSGTITPGGVAIETTGGNDVTGNYTISYETGTLVINHNSSLAPDKITAQKTKTEYTAGDELNTDDLTVTAFYEDGYSQKVTGYTTDAASINMDTAGQKKLTVSYTENGVINTADIALTVHAKPTYIVTVNNGTGSGSYEAGATVTITAETAPSGKQFAGWTVNSLNVTIKDISSETTTFTMPAEAVTVTAVYEDIKPETYSIMVQSDGNGIAEADMQKAQAGTEITLSYTANTGYHFKEWQVVTGDIRIEDSKFTMPSENVTVKAIFEKDTAATYTVTVNNGTGSGSYEEGATVIITAEAPSAGKQFAGWTVESGNVTLTDSSSATTTFTMPAESVTITAEYADVPPGEYSITVQSDGNGTARADQSTAEAGTEITLSYTANAGYHFKEWQVAAGDIRIEDTKFTMPSENVTVKAVFEADAELTYIVTVNNGTGGGTYEAGATVTITADTAPTGKQFAGWKVNSINVTLKDSSSETTTFTMPSEAVTVTAVYEDIQPGEYSITVHSDGNGTAEADMQTAQAGTEITLSYMANAGYHFKEWQVVTGDIRIEDSKFTMPSENVTVKAIFEKDTAATYTVTVNNGTGSGSYEEGAAVSISADETPTGKWFAGWTVESGNVTLEDSSIGTTTFIMPAETVTVTAVYEDI
ncbi:MAG: InlB B-repeat-containing protein [Lachnospiraceae bacterium]